MKPRNKREKEVVELSSKLPQLDKELEWAKDNVFSNKAFLSKKNEAWCSGCAHTWLLSNNFTLNGDMVKCPYCHKELEVEISRKKQNNEAIYMTVVQVMKEYQVLRHIECIRFTSKEEAHLSYGFCETVQEWISKDGKRAVRARPRNMNGGFCRYADIDLRDERYSRCSYNPNVYEVSGEIYPKVKLIPELKKRGMKKNFFDCTPSKISIAVLEGGNDYEFLIKSKQISTLHHMAKIGRYQLKFKHVFNICNRNNYKIKDASLYFDYIEMLEFLQLDTHNPKFICPKNLKKEHDALLLRKQVKQKEIDKRLNEEAMRRRILKKRDLIRDFYKTKLRFMDLKIQSDNIEITPLQSVTQFYQEGKAMHHCVYANDYFAKYCLILSAQIDGRHIETIELSLETFNIIQSRGVCNKATEYHDQIINLVNENINQIKLLAS